MIRSSSERLWSRVDKSGQCWLWLGSIIPSTGYGSIHVDGKSESTHRLAWQLINGAIPDGLFVLHRCDVRHCVNPSHLFLGTQAENVADMVSKGRQAIYPGATGENNNFSRLTWAIARDMRARFSAGVSSQSVLAREYGVSQAQVWNIVRGKQWIETQ